MRLVVVVWGRQGDRLWSMVGWVSDLKKRVTHVLNNHCCCCCCCCCCLLFAPRSTPGATGTRRQPPGPPCTPAAAPRCPRVCAPAPRCTPPGCRRPGLQSHPTGACGGGGGGGGEGAAAQPAASKRSHPAPPRCTCMTHPSCRLNASILHDPSSSYATAYRRPFVE